LASITFWRSRSPLAESSKAPAASAP